MMNNTMSNYRTALSTKIIGGREIKVAVHTPENVRNRQEKINLIYDILKPSNGLCVERVK